MQATLDEIKILREEKDKLVLEVKELRKNIREIRESAKHFEWNITQANSHAKKFLEIVGLDEYGNLKR